MCALIENITPAQNFREDKCHSRFFFFFVVFFLKHAAAEGAASQIAASDVGFEGTRLPHPREGGREGRREQGEIAPKNTLERGVGEEESLAKDLQKSLGEEKPKAGSHSKRLRCVCGECALRRGQCLETPPCCLTPGAFPSGGGIQ